ncbi:MAG: ATP synthase F1 subunit epsilon [Candidatus Choladocola sp.]|nr:ATP synthase F1 subunit epsilon [Candidatus Choladocola sp.]
MADDRNFDLEIITPDRVFWKGKAFMLELNTSEGQVGIYKRHIPMTMILEPGIVTIHLDGENKEAAAHAGFIEVLPEKITVMAEIAEWPDEIDANRAREAQERAQRRLQAHDPKIDISRAEIALKKSLVRQELAKMR